MSNSLAAVSDLLPKTFVASQVTLMQAVNGFASYTEFSPPDMHQSLLGQDALLQDARHSDVAHHPSAISPSSNASLHTCHALTPASNNMYQDVLDV